MSDFNPSDRNSNKSYIRRGSQHKATPEERARAAEMDRRRKERQCVALEAALVKDRKMAIQDRKVVAINLQKILTTLEANGHKKEGLLRSLNMGTANDSTKQLYRYTLPLTDAPEKRIKKLRGKWEGYKKIAKKAAELAGWNKDSIFLELFQGSSYDGGEHASGQPSDLPDYLFELFNTFDKITNWLIRNTDIEEYYQQLDKEQIYDVSGNFFFGAPSHSPDPAVARDDVRARYGKAIPGIPLYRLRRAELPVDFVSEPEDWLTGCWEDTGDEPPPSLPIEQLIYRRYFEIRLGIAPVSGSGRIALVFDQRCVDELWSENSRRAYVPMPWPFLPKSLSGGRSWQTHWSHPDLFGASEPPAGICRFPSDDGDHLPARDWFPK